MGLDALTIALVKKATAMRTFDVTGCTEIRHYCHQE